MIERPDRTAGLASKSLTADTTTRYSETIVGQLSFLLIPFMLSLEVSCFLLTPLSLLLDNSLSLVPTNSTQKRIHYKQGSQKNFNISVSKDYFLQKT